MKKLLIVLLVMMTSLVACSSGSPKAGHLKMADAGWDSIRLHNAIVGFIAQHAYDLSWEEVPGSTPITYEALKMSEIDIYTEIWTDNIPSYKNDVEADALLELSVNFDDNAQGIYVPTYVIKGDPARNIEASAPDLKWVSDLKAYAHIFFDEDNPSQGRLYGAIPGWEVDEIMRQKWLYLGLDDTYVYFSPGSDAALSAAFTAAYEKGQPIVGYYWEPTWLMGKYDFTLLEDEPYIDQAAYEAGQTTFPALPVTVGARPGFDQDYPEFTEFLKHYSTSSALTSAGLAHMQETGANYGEAAKWFIEEYQDLFIAMLPSEKWQLIEAALNR